MGLGAATATSESVAVEALESATAVATPPPDLDRGLSATPAALPDYLSIRRPSGFRSDPRRQATPALPKWDVDPSVVAVTDRSSAVVEQYRAVRTWLLSHSNVGEHDCIALTSAVPQEGKTVTTANLAVVMAEVRHLNVLAVDADVRRGSLAKLYGIEPAPGLADVLAGRAQLGDAIARTPISNLSFLPASKSFDVSPTELFNSKAADLLFDEIRERYHYILVDTPPIQSYSDVGVIGTMCSGIVMVVRMNKTPSNHVRQSLQWLQANNLPVLGCIAAGAGRNSATLAYPYDDD